jgi:hypothetical protein
MTSIPAPEGWAEGAGGGWAGVPDCRTYAARDRVRHRAAPISDVKRNGKTQLA